MKNKWFQQRAEELQRAAERRDTKRFYQLTKELYGPSSKVSAPLLSKDHTLLTDQQSIMDRWKEYYTDLLNRPSQVEDALIDNIEQSEIREDLAEPPTLLELKKAIAELQNSKSPGEDGLPVEIFKHGGAPLEERLLNLFSQIWQTENTPNQLKNAQIVTLYKNKGSKAECSNYRGISLLSVAGKILTKILQTRIKTTIIESAVGETQCGF